MMQYFTNLIPKHNLAPLAHWILWAVGSFGLTGCASSALTPERNLAVLEEAIFVQDWLHIMDINHYSRARLDRNNYSKPSDWWPHDSARVLVERQLVYRPALFADQWYGTQDWNDMPDTLSLPAWVTDSSLALQWTIPDTLRPTVQYFNQADLVEIFKLNRAYVVFLSPLLPTTRKRQYVTQVYLYKHYLWLDQGEFFGPYWSLEHYFVQLKIKSGKPYLQSITLDEDYLLGESN